jgi:CheY-like chemotaxis protein
MQKQTNGRPTAMVTVSSSEQSQQRKILILALERDRHVRQFARYFIEQAGYRVEFTDNGEQTLEQARLLLPEILLTEILVPRLDGLSVCRALKADPATRHIRVLVFSILHAEERARQAGADAFLIKPLNDVRLIHTIEQLLAQCSNQEEIRRGTN